MAKSNSAVITDWKRLWKLVSGIHHETPESTVLEELLNVSCELQDGLLQFKGTAASKTKLETLLAEKKQEKLLAFTLRLQELLDLESVQCWEILCYYLTSEYRGTASSLASLISTENNMTKLLDDIWGYYTLERMIVLKIVKNLLIFYDVQSHPYYKEYKEVVDKIGIDALKESYLQQLDYLINEVPPHKLKAGEFFNYQQKLINWSERNAREIVEISHILLLISEHMRMNFADIKRLFSCFKQHSFGRQQNYLSAGNRLHTELLSRLAYSELSLFLKCIDLEELEQSGKLATDIVKSFDKDVTRMCHNPENGPLLLSWMLVNIRYTNASENDQQLLRCRQMGKRALDLNCFSYMNDMISNSIFKDDSLVSRIVRRTVYNMLCCMCDYFDGDGSCCKYPYIYDLLSELLTWPSLAKDFCSTKESGVHSLFATLLEIFPMDFVHLSMVATALTKAGMGNYVKNQLEALPILTELYDESKYLLKSNRENEYVLMQKVQPFSHIDFEIPVGTSVAICMRADDCYAHFRLPVNFFNVLHHEINCLLIETMIYHGEYESSVRARRVNEGLKYLHVTLGKMKSLAGITAEMVHPTEMCIDLLNKFKGVQSPPIELMANCLNVCTALLPLADAEIIVRVINLAILPQINCDTLKDYKMYAHGVSFDSGLVGSYLVNVEKQRERFNFLAAYLGFLRSYTKLQRKRYFQVEIPGLIFLLRDVFPHIHVWRFQSKQEKFRMYAEIMGFICDVLDEVASGDVDKQSSEQVLLKNICVYSLLNLENALILLRFVAMGNAYLQHTMEMEANWMLQQSHGLVLLVRLAIRILMQVLRLKSSVCETNGLTPLEVMVYTQPKQRDTLRIIPVVTSYMNNIFDRRLPILSCRLLKRIALEFDMSLLACLDMEPDQIRLTFLQKLPDELESDSLKAAILELVEACIEKQPGVTEAFFKVNYQQEKRIFGKEGDTEIADSIVTYIQDYLDAVGKDPEIVEQLLPTKIMNLFHTLWKQNMQLLIDVLINKPNFWENLCRPLFSDLKVNVRVYTQLLNILSIEIFSTPLRASGSFKNILVKFFEINQFKKWLDFVFILPKEPFTGDNGSLNESLPEWLCRLRAFKSFMLIVLKKQPQFVEVPTEQFKILAEKCLPILVERSEYVEDLRPLVLLFELHLFSVTTLKHSCTESSEEDQKMLQQFNQLLSNICSCYMDLGNRAKDACLSLTIKCADLFAEILTQDSTISLSFLQSVVNIICQELRNLENCVSDERYCKEAARKDMRNGFSTTSSILCLNLLKTVATIFHNDGVSNWVLPFLSNKLFQRLLACTSSIVQVHKNQKLTVELLDVLLMFAKGNCSAEFLHCDVGEYLWLKLLPPKELIQTTFTCSLSPDQAEVWSVHKWWPIYARGIELVTLLLQKHSHYFLKEVLQFVGIHEEYLVDSLLLGNQSLEPIAMDLIKCAITLVATLVKFEKQWRLEHSQSLFSLMHAAQMLLGHSIAMFHQPRNLKLLIIGRRSQVDVMRDSESSGLVDEVIPALNDLTEIIILCVKCLQQFSPTLMSLLCEPELLIYQWEPIFEINFGAPKINENAITLSFGTVLSIVGIYTKVLNLQNYGFHEVPLNILCNNACEDSTESNNNSNNDNKNELISNSAVNNNTMLRPFSKSLSVASVSSVNCPPNELLSNLDGELCLTALEHILTLAASQSLLALKNPLLPTREKQLIRREVSSELLSYHEFVRKKVIVEYRDHKEIWQRRKHGQIPMLQVHGNAKDSHPSTSKQAAAARASTQRRSLLDLRVNVVRRLHLQQQQHQRMSTPILPNIKDNSGSFEMSRVLSPIGLARCKSTASIAPTPNLASSSTKEQKIIDSNDETNQQVNIFEEAEEDVQYFPAEEPKYSPLSYIQFVEEDYLHLMSNLFFIICQND
uniref:Nucleoporin NUP188 n=1 Tax=Glossina morsitans morsitans TaxID=37546 RepID=A0A1B0GBY2_GLOMM